MYFGMLKRMLFETDKQLVVEIGLEYGGQRASQRTKAQTAFATRPVFSTLFVHFHHQQL